MVRKRSPVQFRSSAVEGSSIHHRNETLDSRVKSTVGVWPNWLWRTLRVREVLGSSPSTPKIFHEQFSLHFSFIIFFSSMCSLMNFYCRKEIEKLGIRKEGQKRNIGDWRRWLARLHGVQEVTSSSLVSPTSPPLAGLDSRF